MGISNLQSLIETDSVLSASGVRAVDLVKTAWTGLEAGGSSPARLALVLDGESCLDRLYGGYYSDWVCGGQWNHMLEFMSVLFQTLSQANIHTVTFLNGAVEEVRWQSWVEAQLKVKQNVKHVVRHLYKRGTPPPKVWWVAPTAMRSVLRLALRQVCLPLCSTIHCHTLELVSFLRENGYHGILGDHPEFCIFDPPRYFSAAKMKLTLKFTLETQEIVMDEVAKALDLNPNRFCLMAALLGNHILTLSDLREFHSLLVPDLPDNSKHSEVITRAVVNYVRTLVNVDHIEALGAEIFGSCSDPRVAKLKEVVDFYNSGTEDGYKKLKPTSRRKKKDVAIVTALASDIEEEADENRNIYDPVSSTNKSLSAVTKETEETAKKLASLVLSDKDEQENDVDKDKDIVSDNLEAVTAVANNAVKPSEAGKYPQKAENKKSLSNKVSIPVVNVEVMKTAAERHRQATMSPFLYNLLNTGEVLLPALLEDESSQDIPNIHLVYRDLRRRVYGILFNLHHANFTRQKYEEELETARRRVEDVAQKLSKVKPDSVIMKNNEPRCEREVLNERLEAATANVAQLTRSQPADMTESIVVREWLPYNRYQEPDGVTPLPLSPAWPVPTIQRLWFGSGLEDKQRRLRSFLSVMSSDCPLMLNTSHVPQHLLMMGCILRYVMSQNNILRKPELDAFLVTAFAPELGDAEYLAKMKLDLVTPRGVVLATLFMTGLEMALLANDACGAPVPFLMTCPWLFFDGKLFHSKLRRAVTAKNLLEMCDHRMELVVKVERMRAAILDGLVPEYNKPPLLQPMMPGLAMRGWAGHGMGRGGQLVVAGSVVGQWAPNLGPRTRGSRAGRKVKEKKEKHRHEKEESPTIGVKEPGGSSSQE